MRRLASSARGQIVIPALLIFPTLMLFVYLIFETSKLSREKIRHQFAMDSAAFVEMTNYSDFLNRTAYVNGAFPMRIFQEGYGDFMTECEGKTDTCASDKKSYADILYANGAFPRSQSGKQSFSSEGTWDIAYPEPKNGGGSAPDLKEPFMLFTLDNANKFWHPWDLATEIYKLYVQIYSLLGSVEDAQFSVLKKLSSEHSFLKKSYVLNSGDPVDDAALLAKSFDVALGDFNSGVKPYCQQTMDYWGNRHIGGTGIQPYTPAHAEVPIQLPTSAGCSQGLFQIMYVKPSLIAKMRDASGGYPGLSLWMNWSLPGGNYFNVDFKTIAAQDFPNGDLHTTISLMGDAANKPNVWPNPTPKFQVRQFP
jgi:hypothetical protein